MTTTDTRPSLRQRARHRRSVEETVAMPLRRPPVVAFHQHENGRRLVLELFERGYRAGEPFALRDQHGELRLTIGQLEHLVLAAGPAALRRYRRQESALLAGGLDEQPTSEPRDRRSKRRVVASRAARARTVTLASPKTRASSEVKASA